MQNPTSVSRRRFLGAAATASLSLPLAAAGTLDADATPVLDVVIVGAGLSGLTAARELVKAGVSNIAVLEARPRAGGRTFNHDIGHGQVAEGGGQWIGPTQTAILGLCQELGVETFPTYLKGKVVLRAGGGRFTVPYALTATGPSRVQKQIDRLAATIPLNAPWKAKNAQTWDAISLAEWARQNVPNAEERSSLAGAPQLTLGTTADQLSFLYFLYYVHSAGSLHDLESMKGGAQDSRIVGGSQILSIKMAGQLGERVKLDAPVRRIAQTADVVSVETKAGTFRARQAVMALMPGSCTGIQFAPALPQPREQLQKRWVQDKTAMKINVVYEKPFWRQQGFSGMSLSENSAVPLTVDNSPPDGSLGVLLTLTSSDAFPQNAAARKQRILAELAELFGDQARRPVGFHEMNWGAEAYTSGCVSPLAPGVLTRYGAALRESVGRIHWAGTETAEVWTGYMDGAIRAGKHVAGKLIAARKA